MVHQALTQSRISSVLCDSKHIVVELIGSVCAKFGYCDLVFFEIRAKSKDVLQTIKGESNCTRGEP